MGRVTKVQTLTLFFLYPPFQGVTKASELKKTMAHKTIFKALQFHWENHNDILSHDYAYFYSGDYEKIFGFPKKNADNPYKCEGFLKIANGKRKIYVRYKAIAPCKSGDVMLSYENLAKLDAVKKKNEAPAEVTVSPCSYLKYKLCQTNIDAKWAFLIAFASICLSIVSIVFSLVF